MFRETHAPIRFVRLGWHLPDAKPRCLKRRHKSFSVPGEPPRRFPAFAGRCPIRKNRIEGHEYRVRAYEQLWCLLIVMAEDFATNNSSWPYKFGLGGGSYLDH